MRTNLAVLGAAFVIAIGPGGRAGGRAHADDAPPAPIAYAPITLANASQVDLVRTLDGPTDRVRCVAFEPNGPLLAAGSKDGTVRLWNVDAGGPPAVLRAAPC